MRRVAHVLGELMITLGLVVLLYCAYSLLWTDVTTKRAQAGLRDQLDHGGPTPVGPMPADPNPLDPMPGDPNPLPGQPTRRPVVAPAVGKPLAVLHIPRFGERWSWIVVEGVDLIQLADGPGPYPGTALPGRLGNFAVAGHQVTHGSLFALLARTRVGDQVDVDVGGRRYVYVVTSAAAVAPDDVGAVAPVPDHPGARPTQRMVTLTTCHPPYRSTQRFVVHGLLHGVRTAADSP